MNWEKYLEMSEKTLSTEFHCSEKEERLLHGTIGILTELEELMDNHLENKKLDIINVVEEISDITWYLAILGREFNIPFKSSEIIEREENSMNIILNLVKNTCKILDMIKKKLFYNKIIDDSQFISITKSIMESVSIYANIYDIDIEKAFDVNIEKLRSRYGDKFSSHNAINRNIKEERNILEKGN